MPTLDIDSALSEVTSDAPCGPNLEYDPLFLELEQAVQGKGEVQLGHVITAAVVPDWKLVARLASNLLKRSRDLRVIVILLRASLALEGFPGMATYTTLIDRFLQDRWDSVHPQLDADDGNDPTLRINSLAVLSDSEMVLRQVKEATLIVLPGLGRITVRDLEAAAADSAMPETQSRIPLSSIKAALLDVAPEELRRTIDALTVSGERTRSIETLLVHRVGSSRALNLDPLTRLLMRSLDILLSIVPNPPVHETAASIPKDGAQSDGLTNTPAGVRSFSGTVTSRADVKQLLESILVYYAQYEPSSPVPLVLERVQRLVNMNFLELLQDLAPEGVSQFTVVSGSKAVQQ